MKTIQILTIFLLAMSLQAMGAKETQKENNKESILPVSFGLFYGLTMNSGHEQSVNYFSFSMIGDDGHAVRGLSLAPAFSYKTGKITGAQITGGVNFSGDLTGSQITGGFNKASQVKGSQIAGGFNLAEEVSGVQIAGGINLAKKVYGAQVGVINMAKKVKGVQVGVINISEDSSFSLGLINIVKNGRTHVSMFFDNELTTSIELKHGGKYWHMVYGFGIDFRDIEKLQLKLGLGGHIPFKKHFFLDIDFIDTVVVDTSKSFTDNDWNRYQGAGRLQVGYRFNDYFSVVAGAKFNVVVQDGDYDTPDGLTGWMLKDGKGDKNIKEVYAWPTIMIGVQLL